MAPTYLICCQVDPTLHWANPPGGTAGRDMRPTFTATPAGTRVRCPLSPTYMVRWAWATRVTAMPKHGIFHLPTTSRRAMPRWAPGMTASRRRPTKSLAQLGGRGTPRSSIQTPKSCLDHLVSRSCARHDAAERLRWAGRLLHCPRRSGGRCRCARLLGDNSVAKLPGPAPARGDGAGTKYYEIPIAIAGSCLQQRWIAVLSRTRVCSSMGSPGRISRRPTSRRSGTRVSSATASW